jgi:hypothetical protein
MCLSATFEGSLSADSILDATYESGETSLMSDESKRYSDREVSLIIQSALDLEMKDHLDKTGGLLQSEIEEIARDTGISVDHIRLAINGMPGGKKNIAARRFFGSDTSFERIEIIPQSLTQDELERLNQSLPILTNAADSSVVNGDRLTWKRSALRSFLDGFPLSLSVKKSEGGTAISAHARLNSIATLLFAISGGLGVVVGMKLAVFAMLLIGIGKIALPTSLLLLATGGVVGLGGFWLLARLAFRAFMKRSQEKVVTMIEKIKAAITGMKK